MRAMSVGRPLFAASLVLAGILGIVFQDFALVFGEVPKTIAGHDVLVMASGAILLLGGGGLLVPRIARIAALVLTVELLLFALLLRVPDVVKQPLVEASWYGLGETLALVAGAWTILSVLPARREEPVAKLGHVRRAQLVFGVSLIPLGLAHFFYLGQTAPLVPAWLPLHVPLAYLTGAAHIAAGLAILLRIVPGIAAALEAAMASLFTLLVWVPAVIATPKALAWTELAVSLAIAGAAWAVTDSFRATRPEANPSSHVQAQNYLQRGSSL